VLVGDREAPLGAAQRGGEVTGQSSMYGSPAGQLAGVVVAPEQGGQPRSQFHPRARRAARRRLINRAARALRGPVVVGPVVVGPVVTVLGSVGVAFAVVGALAGSVLVLVGGVEALEDGRVVQAGVGALGHAEETAPP